jgi:hypothetical protein
MVAINYFPTSVQKLYRIGTTGEWLAYNDQPIKVNQGLTIYAKGIDQYGNQTRTISSYTANVPDALGKEVFDGNNTTYIISSAVKYIKVDSSMQGKNVRVLFFTDTNRVVTIRFLDKNRQLISEIIQGSPTHATATYDKIYQIPVGTEYISYNDNANLCRLYEIQSKNQ